MFSCKELKIILMMTASPWWDLEVLTVDLMMTNWQASIEKRMNGGLLQ